MAAGRAETSPLLPLHSATQSTRPRQDHDNLPQKRVHWLSRVTFSWLGPLLVQGAAQPLQAEDLWPLEPEDEAAHVANTLRRAMQNGGHSNQSLWHSIRQAFGFNLYVAGACKLSSDGFGFVGPICVNALLQYIDDPKTRASSYDGYLLCTLLLIASVLQTLCLHHHDYLVTREASRVRSALTMLVYEKSLALSWQQLDTVSPRRIVHMATIDAHCIFKLGAMLHYAWTAPVQLILGILLLWHFLGRASIAGIFVMVVVLPMSAYITAQAATIANTRLECTAKRLDCFTRVVQYIRAIKMYAWESDMLFHVTALRGKELESLQKSCRWDASSRALRQACPVLVSLATFAAYSYVQTEPLPAAKAFTAITLFQLVRSPLMVLPHVLSVLSQAKRSMQRLESFLYLPLEPCTKSVLSPSVPCTKSVLSPSVPCNSPFYAIQHATFQWSRDGPKVATDSTGAKKAICVSNLTFSIPKNKLTLIVGAAGSGKSTLVATLLGEMHAESGVVYLPTTKIAFAAQRPYLINASVQENILFGAPVDTARLHRVIKSCDLEYELGCLPKGFQSEIGDREVTLSRGQIQRLCLARALYVKDQNLYVFDDSFAAVDEHVAMRVFNQCLNGKTNGLLAGQTRVLSTPSLRFAHFADWIIVMENLRVVEMGSFQDLTQLAPNGKFARMLTSFRRTDDVNIVLKDPTIDHRAERVNRIRSKSRSAPSGDRKTLGRRDVVYRDDEKAIGKVSWRIYVSYFKSCGAIPTIGALALLIAAQLSSVSTDLWLTNWISKKPTRVNLTLYLSIYAYLGLSTSVLGFVGDLYCRDAGLSASKEIHHRLLRHVMKGTMRFFNTTPVGQIVSRFTNDMNSIDQTLNSAIVHFVTMVLALCSMLGIQSSMAPGLLLLFIPVFICYVAYQRFYEKSYRELQRLERISKSPVYAHLTQTLCGSVTIRTFNAVTQSERTQTQKIDDNTKAFLLLHLIDRWLGVRLDILGAIITVAVAVVVSSHHFMISSAMAGLLLSYSQNMTFRLNGIVRSSMDLVNNMKSVERIDAYCRVETEPITLLAHPYERYTCATSHALHSRPHWPEHGKLDFVNICVKYEAHLPRVLKSISFTIHGGEKVGICGQTGAGKSSLLLALFRMVPLDTDIQGSNIYIDEVSITALTLTELRSRMAIIPQDPVLFAASVRINLDPTGQATEKQLLNALRKSHLETFIKELRGGLDAELLDGGANFSVGERQRICLARAILRNSRILCLDEPPASMDYSTDKIIQASILREFADSTVLTIAHRVETLRDYDKILVLKQGEIAEFGSPSELLSRPKGEFAGMLNP